MFGSRLLVHFPVLPDFMTQNETLALFGTDNTAGCSECEIFLSEITEDDHNKSGNDF